MVLSGLVRRMFSSLAVLATWADAKVPLRWLDTLLSLYASLDLPSLRAPLP